MIYVFTIIFYLIVLFSIGILLAYSLIQFFPRILDAAFAAYTVYGAGITPALMATFFWKRATVSAGVFSILSGMSVTIIWEIIRKLKGDFLFGIPAVYPALAASVSMLVILSLLQPPPTQDRWKRFF